MKIFIISILTFLNIVSFGQSKKSAIIINLGFHQTDSYKKLFYNSSGYELIYPTQQLSSVFLDFNLLYTRPTKNSKLKTIVGIGFNQKGFVENGMASDGSPNYYFYESKLKKSYISIYTGLSYDLLSYKKIKIILGQLLIPEIDLDNNFLYKKVTFATRTNLTFSWKVSARISFLLTPYFQTALTRYNKTKLNNNSSDYMPYCFGLNFGLSLVQ